MNSHWKAFLSRRNIDLKAIDEPDEALVDRLAVPSISALPHLSVLQVRGKDSTTFLQGQTTCDISKLSPSKASLGAICNHKGRAIAIFLILTEEQGYRLILPTSMVSTVAQKLRMFILRSDVRIQESSDEQYLAGLSFSDSTPAELADVMSSSHAPFEVTHQDTMTAVQLGQHRNLLLLQAEHATALWETIVDQKGFSESGPDLWILQDILDGIPWIETQTREQFVPQMINLDLLGGISFEKGCYTGQEVVARMHFLGNLKKQMYLAACNINQLPEPGTPLYTSGNGQNVGQVVSAAPYQKGIIRMLIVLQIEQSKGGVVKLSKADGIAVEILNLPYTLHNQALNPL